MRTIRLYFAPQSPTAAPPREGEEVELAPPEASHGVLALRLQIGDPLELVGSLGIARAEVTFRAKSPEPALRVRLLSPWTRLERPEGPVLAMAIVRPAAFDLIAAKAVELGASALIPLFASRGRVPRAQIGEAKRERWERLVREALKVSGRDAPFALHGPLTLDQFWPIARARYAPSPLWLLDPLGSPPPFPLPPNPLLLVGPEGGFSPEEKEKARAEGFTPVSLGRANLKAETAALAALALVTVGQSLGEAPPPTIERINPRGEG
ncbi:MAG: RsmE family RNA methyltransferase [Deltaproteobacteria bacterium]|jgi:16S rRNA (uracil1498-N3)-methyltransferase|nr:RsmE family RNA methyltransferase [Deltaproteobacteria bacterium]